MQHYQWAGLVTVVLAAALPAVSFAQSCTDSIQTGIMASTVTIQGSGSVFNSVASSAAGMWNSCPGGGGAALPNIQVGTGGDLHYTVFIVPVSSGPACGVLDPTNREITVAEKYTHDNQQYDCNVQTVLAHEIGHALGLGHPTGSCDSYLMSQVNVGQPDTRSLQLDECTRANQNVTTGIEEQRQEEQDRCAREPQATGCGSPLILDMNDDGINTTSRYRPVSFDFEGEGQPVETSWTDPTSEEAFLALDLNRNGRIDSGLELFGTFTLLPSGQSASHGFEALAVYDDPASGGNGDGRISPRDRIWRRLRLWVDRNHNGISERSEQSRLLGIRAIDLEFVETDHFDGNVNWHRFIGTFERWCWPFDTTCAAIGVIEDVFFDLGDL